MSADKTSPTGRILVTGPALQGIPVRTPEGKAIRDAHLDHLIEQSRRAVEAMSPEEYEEMLRRQRESWMRQDWD